MSTTPTERRLAITPDPMTTDKNKVSELLEVPLENWNELVRENRRLRQERDDLVGALEEIRSIPLFANSDAEHVFAVQRIAKAVLSKHKPE